MNFIPDFSWEVGPDSSSRTCAFSKYLFAHQLSSVFANFDFKDQYGKKKWVNFGSRCKHCRLILIGPVQNDCTVFSVSWNGLADEVILHQEDVSHGWEEVWLPRIGIAFHFLASPTTLWSDNFLPSVCSLSGATSTFSIGFPPSLTRSLNLIDQPRLPPLITHQHHDMGRPILRGLKKVGLLIFIFARIPRGLCCSLMFQPHPHKFFMISFNEQVRGGFKAFQNNSVLGCVYSALPDAYLLLTY